MGRKVPSGSTPGFLQKSHEIKPLRVFLRIGTWVNINSWQCLNRRTGSWKIVQEKGKGSCVRKVVIVVCGGTHLYSQHLRGGGRRIRSLKSSLVT